MSVQASSSTEEAVNIPAFITKLWMLVEDKETDNLIKWSQDGSSFIVYDQSQFATDVLPKYFKHNNMNSFVRQLNMYGFRKKFQPEQGGLIRPPKANQTEFHHQHFVQGKSKQLSFIKRKMSNKEDLRLHSDGVSSILKDVKQMKSKQDGITGKLDNMQRENEALWREVMYLRKRHEQQQKIVTRLIQFLVTMAQQKNPIKRTQLPMIEAGLDAPSKAKYSKQLDDFLLQTDAESMIEPLVTSGATLSEVEDLPPEILGATSSSDLQNVEELNLPIYTEDAAAELPLDLVGYQPIVTSPAGSQIPYSSPDTGSATEDTGQMLPVSLATAIDSQLLTPQVPQEQQAVAGPPALQRALSVEEQRQEIGDQVTGIQNNLEFIQNLLEASPRLNMENIWENLLEANPRLSIGSISEEIQVLAQNKKVMERMARVIPYGVKLGLYEALIFRTDEGADSNDFLSKLSDSNGLNTPNTSSITGTELVQYQPSSLENSLPSTIFSEEDENLLLTSLDEDARNLVASERSKEDES